MPEKEKHEKTLFVTPKSLTDAEARRRELAEKIGDIATQLSDRDRCHPDGRRFTDAEYHAWRKKALGALRAHERVLRQTNDWIKQERRLSHAEKTAASPEELSALRLISDAYSLFVKLRDDDVEFDDAEWQVIERLRNYLDKSTPTTAASVV